MARCGVGHPLVIRNHPIDPGGNPFPTLYWLTCPDAVKAVSRVEADGWIRKLNEQAEIDPDLRTALRRAHEEYARERGRLVPGAERWGGVGGTGKGVKCLHAHYAYHLVGGVDPIGRWVAHRLARGEPVHYEKPGRRLAAIDLGTNSVRLLVARVTEGSGALGEIARDMVITRLGQGVDRTGSISAEALRRTLAVVERYCRRARALGAERVHLAATSAARDAANREELAQAVERLTGEPMEVLSGRQEAARSFVGGTRGLASPGPFLVVDIGGGSTEFALGEREASAAVSAQIGSVRLTERYVHTDPPSF
jgi:exopolyphosphatase / guanosine-5'-triphosphate,3'-diphosphate pyrophosphatase